MKDRSDLAYSRNFAGRLILVLPCKFIRQRIEHCLEIFRRLQDPQAVHFQDPEAGDTFKFCCDPKHRNIVAADYADDVDSDLRNPRNWRLKFCTLLV